MIPSYKDTVKCFLKRRKKDLQKTHTWHNGKWCENHICKRKVCPFPSW